MGQNAFLERYEKPNYKLHVIIFVVIIAASVFLSTKVEKSKENTNVAALKTPVPIDSVTLAEKTPARQVTPKVKPSVTKEPVATGTDLPAPDTNRSAAFEQQHELSAADQLAANKVSGSVENSEPASDVAADADAAVESSEEPLEEVFDHQHDRFLQTLAKTAEIESQESLEVRKIKQAIRQDKPIKTAAAADTNLKQQKPTSTPQNAETTETQQSSKQTAKPGAVQQKRGSRQARALDNSSVPVAMRQAQPVTPVVNKRPPGITTKELNGIMSRFTNSYNKGNIGQLMALFHDSARTNDRTSKRGIAADYAELFNNTQSRKLMINNVNWRVQRGKAEGAATFEVVVQPKNSTQANRIRGSIRIVAEKDSQGVYITRLVHNIKQ